MADPYGKGTTGGLPTLVIPSAISGSARAFNPRPGFGPLLGSGGGMGGPQAQPFSGTVGSGIGAPRPAQISPGGRSVVDPNARGPILGGTAGAGIAGGGSFYDRMFSNQNPILQNMGGILGAGIKGNLGAMQPPTGGAGGDAAMHPEEKKWKILAEKYGVNWDVTKSVYMRSPRNPNFSPSTAIELQLDDKAWGDAALAAGILTGNADYDKNVWDDHYLANGNIARDPMAGHNYAQMAYQANQQAIQDQVNGVPTPPEWLG
jgi:hypothetical protein